VNRRRGLNTAVSLVLGTGVGIGAGALTGDANWAGATTMVAGLTAWVVLEWRRVRQEGGSAGIEASQQSPGTEIVPRSPGTEAVPYPPGTETVPSSIGIETQGGRFTPLIRKGTPLPVSLTQTWMTYKNQSSMTIRLFQGEESLAARNMGLGLFEVTEIPPAKPLERQIEVTFHVDASGAFSMTARMAQTGQELPVLQR
jgi:hypothetical protein